MSLWNFLCEFAVFNAVCDLFSSKNKPVIKAYDPYCHNDIYEDYPYNETCVETLREDLDDLDNRLARLDDNDNRYAEIQERIDDIRSRIDGFDMDDMYDGDLDDICDDLDDLDDICDELDELEQDLDDLDDDW